MSAEVTPWTLKGPYAALACGQLSAHVDLRVFDLGVHAPQWGASPLEARVLGPQLPPVVGGKSALTEIYVRGPDLVASCEGPGPLPVVPQFYWRVRRHESQSAVSVELI